MNNKCTVFYVDDNRYINVELVKNKNIVIRWMNYPVEIIYTCSINSAKYFDGVVSLVRSELNRCKDMGEARSVIEEMYGPNVCRTSEEICDLQDRAFKLSEGRTDEYFSGVFDALDWVLGDDLDKEIWGENNV